MADNLCGPSNALQNFQKQSNVDRTLQQDRLISRQSPSQGFRSSPGPNSGALDPEFQAFQAGRLPLGSQQGFNLSHHNQNPQQGLDGPWANDFKRLQLFSQQPILEQTAHQSHHAPNLQSSGWAQDYQQMQGGQRETVPQQMGGYSAYQSFQGPSRMRQYGGPMISGAIASGNSMSQHQAPEMPQEPAFDDAAFAKAFEDAFADAAQADQEQASSQQQSLATGQGSTTAFSADELGRISTEAEYQSFFQTLDAHPMPGSVLGGSVKDYTRDKGLINQEPIGADIIHDPTDKTYPQSEREDPTELSRTAGHLLDVVSESNNDKFANSQFMQLMRQLRDREVEVAGRDMVDTKTGHKIGEESEGIQVQA
ncbi:hypothetical protein BJ878DRAFT_493147 [Calycina marina]|uniref:Peroxin 20 n=1 Tax=Calycina marina TaxID=1763456 RepID=A0A9P8CHI1_9HELO|nr:hypothetical protein BJ878DRAFT_493147 [Calycina marina]